MRNPVRFRLRRRNLTPKQQALLQESDAAQFRLRLITSGVTEALKYGLDDAFEFDTCIEKLREARKLSQIVRQLHDQVYAKRGKKKT